ncbi:unnamed protein product [Linum tenue]|uniref:Uncharacterized protein n=2 Tax=Linum tenue TaxID=586396 RepID=A0AAV0N276_9ROSI|nr:unnamed protein product [Linum tenue]
MESTEVKKRSRGRPRKRRREEESEKNDKKTGGALKKRASDIWCKPLLGRFVLKEFEGNGLFLGKIVHYDTGLYRVEYEDGDCEDLDSSELRSIILGDNDFDDALVARRERLDEILIKKHEARKELEKQIADSKDQVAVIEAPPLCEMNGKLEAGNDVELENDADSSSDSCDYAQEGDLGLEEEVPVLPPPELPPSSGNLGVPEEYVSHLFSVYAFLRSFNIQLFLSPFSLDDLVGAINCRVQNTLLDSIHVALMRVIRRRMEMLATEGLELASKCLMSIDWNLLDLFTWPVFLVNYLTVMGYAKGSEWQGFHDDLLKKEYYLLTAGKKLMTLQVLCDDVLDSVEVRAEIDSREEAEFGIDPDSVANGFLESGPRRVHPRFSKTSACKDTGVTGSISESHGIKSSQGSTCVGLRSHENNSNAPISNSDWNSDDCRLCGMDGTLLCCDGCPAAYHSRCIGVGKMYIPDGPWYCPECIINRMSPSVTVGTSLKGAEVFGIDLYQQVFVATCDHLLVLRALADKEHCFRYYGQKDIPNVLRALCASEKHRLMYLEISKLIAKYWNIPQIAFCPAQVVEKDLEPALVKEELNIPSASAPAWEISQRVPDVIKAENQTSSNGKISVSCVDTLGEITTPAEMHCSLSSINTTRTSDLDWASTKLPGQFKVDGTMSSTQADPSGVTHTTCNSANSDSSHVGRASGTSLPTIISFGGKDANLINSGTVGRYVGENVQYVGASFKPKAYINHYAHGDFAALAAATLAALSPEETRASDVHKSSGTKKASADILLQAKAFSKVASRFFWPSSEKKLMEVPRERCGWCHSCKLTTNSKRGCMLNSAGLILTKSAMKIINSLRPTIMGDGSLPSISTYIMYVGDALSGLTIGPFLSASYKKQWLKRVEVASTCSAIKGPLLELEENIRRIALSGDWVKAVDNWVVGTFISESAATENRSVQRRGPAGKRHKKQSALSDRKVDGYDDKSFVWWRGGNLLKHVFHNAILPGSMMKKVARQGGSGKFSSICYTDDSEIPRRSRQLAWRAAVEECKNSSQLALQVRYLDLHVRWNDLSRPELNIQDSKGPETEASVFRNAVICDKQAEEKKITYGVAFGNQKHLPSRIMKNVIRVEKNEDGNDKYWFSEANVPLYLIKEYEGKRQEAALLPVKKPNSALSELQRQQLKASRRDIFSYLVCRRDGVEKCSCASCQLDVPLRDTVICSACHGYCHKDCTLRSTTCKNNVLELLLICKRCCNARTPYIQLSNKSPTTPLPSRGPEYNNSSMFSQVTKLNIKMSQVTKPNIQSQHLAAGKTKEIINCRMNADAGVKIKVPDAAAVKNAKDAVPPKTQQKANSASKASKNYSWGIIWMKNGDDTGVAFRRNKVLVKGHRDGSSLSPECVLCRKIYDPNLMYISCETCGKWLHADAVELEESKLHEVVGFKCCRCRRIKNPQCPYKDEYPSTVVAQVSKKKYHKKLAKQVDPAVDSDTNYSSPATPIFFPTQQQLVLPNNDPLLPNLSQVEQITPEQKPGLVDGEWSATLLGPQKLQVRRQTKQYHDGESTSSGTDFQPETNGFLVHNHPTETYVPGMDWDDLGSGGGACGGGGEGELILNDDEGGFNFEDMEFEPQTYFSFTELLEQDEAAAAADVDVGHHQAAAEVDVGHHQAAAEVDVGHHQAAAAAAAAAYPWDDTDPAMEYENPCFSTTIPPCQFCSLAEPVSDLSCEICGTTMHSSCAFVAELPPDEEGKWRCGNCREWR